MKSSTSLPVMRGGLVVKSRCSLFSSMAVSFGRGGACSAGVASAKGGPAARRALLLGLASCVLARRGATQAAPVRLRPDIVEAFGGNAVDVTARQARGGHSLDLAVRVRDLLNVRPRLQAQGLMNPDVTATYAAKNAFSVAWAFGMSCAAGLLEPIYEDNPALDALAVRVAAVFPDDFGHLQNEALATFGFSRALFRKINWEEFEPRGLPKVALSYRSTPFFTRKFAEERAR